MFRRIDPLSVILAAPALSLAVPFLDLAATNRVALLQHFVYFALGAYFPVAVERMTQLGRAQAAWLGAAAVLLTFVLPMAHMSAYARVLPISLVGVPFAVRTGVAIARWPALARLLAHLGRRTLPIYVLHVPVLAVVHLFIAPRFVASESWLGLAAVAVYPVVLILAVVLACLGLHRALEAVGAGLLFDGPLSRPPPTELPAVNAAGPRTTAQR